MRAELTRFAHTIAHRVGRTLERQGRLARDAERSALSGDAVDAEPMAQLLGHAITVGCRGNGGAHEFAGTRNLVNLLLAHCGTGRLSFLYLKRPALA